MVTFDDGATLAQLSLPDMRLPIGYALAWPQRCRQAFGAIDWAELSHLDFERPDLAAFPCLGLAREAGMAGGSAPAWANAANEVAVAAFLDGRIEWSGIAAVLKSAMSEHDGTEMDSAEAVVEVDRRGRELAGRIVESSTA